MVNCTLANTSARNRATGHVQALCAAVQVLIPATQSHRKLNAEVAVTSVIDALKGHADASRAKNRNDAGWRICALCNERAFAIGHDHGDNIVTHDLMGDGTESTQREVLP